MNLNLSNINPISANPETGYQGNCGNTMVAIAYLLTYLVISFLIVINMYIAVILENYSQATEDVTVISLSEFFDGNLCSKVWLTAGEGLEQWLDEIFYSLRPLSTHWLGQAGKNEGKKISLNSHGPHEK